MDCSKCQFADDPTACAIQCNPEPDWDTLAHEQREADFIAERGG